MQKHLRSIVAVVVAVGCGSGPKPHDTSVAEHDRSARAHEALAADLETSCYEKRRNELTVPAADPSNPKPQDSAGLPTAGAPCWKQADKRFVDAHRHAAAEHRAASAALRAAEAQACAGISSEDRDISPFERTDDIASVEPLVQTTYGSKSGASPRQVGTVVTFRAVPGMTAEWLQRIVDCHLARNAALGHVVPEMPDCPLVPRGVEAHVRSIGNGFAVEIRSDDPDTAREVLARAQRLAHPTTSQR